MKNNNQKKGFTLIELLVVIAIISVLSGVVLQSLSSTRAKSRDAVRLQNIESIAKGFQVATTGNTNQFPSSVVSGTYAYKCLGRATTETCWTPPYGGLDSINTVLRQGLSGSIPFDPLFTISQDGGAYLYNSNDTSHTPVGAYLSWKMENDTKCGRGVALVGLCYLYIGPPVL